MECLEFKEELVDLSKTATHNVWLQYDINVTNHTGEAINVSEHYMPEEEQQKLIDYMGKNYKKLAQYKRSKTMFYNHVAWERLQYFPSSVQKPTDEHERLLQ